MPRPRNLPRARLSCLPRREPVPIGQRQRLVQQIGEIAAVIGRAVRRLVRHVLGPDVVAAAQFDPVDPHLARRRIDQPLHIVVRLGPSGAAIGPDRRRVGEHAFRVHLDQRRPVDAERVALRVARRRPGSAVGRAEIAVAGQPHRQEIAVLVERQLGGHLVVAAVRVGDKAAGALVGPFDRAAEFARRVQHAEIFRHVRLLHAERAADPVGNDPHLVAPDAEHAGDVVAEPEHALIADMDREMLPFAGRIRRARRAARSG